MNSRARYVSTVRLLIPRVSATSALDRPRETSATTCSSRVEGRRTSGRATDRSPPHPDPTLKFFYVTVSIESVIQGSAHSPDAGVVDVRLVGDHSKLKPFVTDHRLLLFLKNGAELLREEGRPPEEQEPWRFVYLPLGPGGVVRDMNGVARAQREFADCCRDFYPASDDGAPFDAVVESIAGGG